MDLRVKRLTADDYHSIVGVWADAGLTYRPGGRDSQERVAREMQRRDTAYFGIDVDNRLAAVAVATYDGRKGWINRVAVVPDHRRIGLAKALVSACERFLSEHGALVIACLIEEWNLPSMDLFNEMGFVCHTDIHYFSKRRSADD